jgi:PLD-like domain
MRVLTPEARQAVKAVIDENLPGLRSIPGFVSAEPGFPIIDGAVVREPAILVFVKNKKPPSSLLQEEFFPRQLGRYRVSVMQADPLRQLTARPDLSGFAASFTLSDSELTYEGIDGNPIDEEFPVSTAMLCHVGPDAGWPVLKPFLEATEETLAVAMYDFNADYVAKTFIKVVRDNGVKSVFTWDDSMTNPEREIREKLRDRLGERLDGWIVKCGASRRFASAYHEKVAVRDHTAFWLSSGNWSKRSQPDIDPIGDPASASGMYSKGNREWHIIVEDPTLAQVFERYIVHDRNGSEQESEEGEPGVVLADEGGFPDVLVPLDTLVAPPGVEAEIPTPKPPQSLPTAPRQVIVRPVLSPDNYIDRIMELLKSARRSIYLQFSYINFSDREGDERFTEMLTLLAELSFKPTIDMRIIVDKRDAANKIRLLVEQGFNDRVFKTQSNIHNKGILVDGKIVLVSSANWSSDGVLRNRDAGLIIRDEEIAGYYQDIFLDDWDNRATSFLEDDPPVQLAAEDEPTPPGMVRMSWRDYFA